MAVHQTIYRLIIPVTLTLAGCVSMAPEDERSALPVPATYPELVATQDGVAVDELDWQAFFTDPVLSRLIETALQNNRDLRTAALKVDEARAAFRIQHSDRFPALNIGSQAARSQISADQSPFGQPMVGSEYRAEVGLTTWEIDLWGRVRNLERAALENWLATEAARQAVHTALIAEVANGYLGLRELEERVEIARQSVATRQASAHIFERRYAVGATARLDVTQVQTLLTQAQSLLAQLEQQRATQLHALQVLVGADPGVLPQKEPFDETTVLAPLDAGLPSELLIRRPDIIAAEHQLRAANANIGAARAAFFPRIALTGSLGTVSAELAGLFESGSKAWTFIPTLSLPIFDGGRRRANLELSEVRRDLAVAAYEKTIQNAFREVADALAGYHWLREQLEAQLAGRDAQTERAHLAQRRYDQGSAAYLEVLDAQRDLLEVQQRVVQTRRALLSSQIALYRALGGGIDAL